MSKRLAVPILGVSLALCVMMLCAAPAFGSVLGTAHDQAIGDQGTCSSCHIPHKALGARMWPLDMGGYSGAYGDVGALCYYCHGAGGGMVIADTVQNFVMSAGTDDDLTHGRDALMIPNGDAVDDTLPHGGNNPFECTTCHNVHDDSNKPFLQDDIDVLCSRCHNNRLFVGGLPSQTQDAWGDFYGADNPGSHPVGTDVWDDSDAPANSPIDMSGSAELTYVYDSGPTTHNLGGHLIDGVDNPASGNGITCVTCHAVHGVQLDSIYPLGMAPVANLLTIDQPTANGGSIKNGDGDPRNALCEACHGTDAGATATIDASTGVAYTGSLRVNPGSTIGTHPVDDLGAAGSASVGAFPAGWPVGSAAGTNVSPAPICESCHTPHPNANSGRASIFTASGTHILRGSEDDTSVDYVCTKCHTFAEGAGHHPSNVAMPEAGPIADSLIGNRDGTLTCGDCHEAGSGAHNWAGAGVGLDPDWEPAGNGRGLAADERVTAGASKECWDCHYKEGASDGPTANIDDDGSAVGHTWRTDSPSYQDIGSGTHFLGDTTMAYNLGNFGGAFDATSDNWTGQGQANPRWSRFDGDGVGTGTVVCESCHDIEADKNVPDTAMLLAYYADGSTTADADPSGLCEGCHGTQPGGGNPHPMTGDNVTRMNDTLSTSRTGDDRFIRATGIITSESNATFPASDAMNCDSCHQPHDADTEGGTYIYDSGEHVTVGAGIAVHDVTNDGTGTTPDAFGNVRGVALNIEDATFCDSCHYYTD